MNEEYSSIYIHMQPFWAVRSTKKWKFNDRSTKYHEQMNSLRLLIWQDKERIIQALLDWKLRLFCLFEMPKSWSKKKKEKMKNTPKLSKPDSDNCWKAFVDTIFYNTGINDSKVWNIMSQNRRDDVGEKWMYYIVIEK